MKRVVPFASLRNSSLLAGEDRGSFYVTVFGIWLIVAIYAIAHDQYIVTIAPEHFTVYHPNPHGIENSRLLAAWSAVLASVSPGLLLGDHDVDDHPRRSLA